jgi:hypothetical protein
VRLCFYQNPVASSRFHSFVEATRLHSEAH